MAESSAITARNLLIEAGVPEDMISPEAVAIADALCRATIQVSARRLAEIIVESWKGRVMTKEEEIDLVREIVVENGKTWAELWDRGKLSDGVRLSFEPLRGYIATLAPGAQHPDWVIHEAIFEQDEVAGFFAAFGTHWLLLLGLSVQVGSEPFKVRAFIANARKRGRRSWSVSLERSKEGRPSEEILQRGAEVGQDSTNLARWREVFPSRVIQRADLVARDLGFVGNEEAIWKLATHILAARDEVCHLAIAGEPLQHLSRPGCFALRK